MISFTQCLTKNLKHAGLIDKDIIVKNLFINLSKGSFQSTTSCGSSPRWFSSDGHHSHNQLIVPDQGEQCSTDSNLHGTQSTCNTGLGNGGHVLLLRDGGRPELIVSNNCPPMHLMLRRHYASGQGFRPRKAPEEVDESESGRHAFQNIYGNLRRPKAKPKKTPEKDRRVAVSWEVSVKYLNSKTFKDTYGDYKIWQMYRRNFKGPYNLVPFNTRESCIGDDGYIQVSNPCPICRDKYLILDYRNTKLLKQFVDPFTDQLLDNRRTHLCCVKYEDLITEYVRAKEFGTISFTLPNRRYDYKEYYHKNLLKDYQEVEAIDSMEDPVMKKIALYPDFITEEPAAYSLPNILPETLLVDK